MTLIMTLIMMKMKKAYEKAYETGVWKRRVKKAYEKAVWWRHVTNYGPLGGPLGCLGVPSQFSRICRKLDAQFRANVSICTRLRIEFSLPEFAYGARGARGNGSQSAAQTPPGHTRRGLGLRELNKLPQIKQIRFFGFACFLHIPVFLNHSGTRDSTKFMARYIRSTFARDQK